MDEELDSLAAIANAIKEGNQLLADTIKDILKGKVQKSEDMGVAPSWVAVYRADLEEMVSRLDCQHVDSTLGQTCYDRDDDSICDSCITRRWAERLLNPEVEEEEENPNENVLEGFRCPECGSYGPYRIAADAFFEVHDDGTDHHEDVGWNDDSVCICKDCGFNGTVAAFCLPTPPQKAYEPIGGGGGHGRSDLPHGQGGGD